MVAVTLEKASQQQASNQALRMGDRLGVDRAVMGTGAGGTDRDTTETGGSQKILK